MPTILLIISMSSTNPRQSESGMREVLNSQIEEADGVEVPWWIPIPEEVAGIFPS
jgi:hypothetical protein